ncbi:MAG: hypothetical protein IKP46_03510 [Bacteroidales bacterium]|nr:hypothetical protein [Bacteroidales bacterium]
MNLKKVFLDFSSVIKRYGDYLTEDTVRYCFFSSMLRQDKCLNHYILELPFSEINHTLPHHYPITANISTLKKASRTCRQEIDLLYDDGAECLCVEFKFHRSGQLKSTPAKTDAAGSIFNDLRRLNLIGPFKGKDVRRLLVYVTDIEMNNYFAPKLSTKENPMYRQALSDFYLLPTDRLYIDRIDTIKDTPQTFKSSASGSFNAPANFGSVTKLYETSFRNLKSPSLKTECFIKVYEVTDGIKISE